MIQRNINVPDYRTDHTMTTALKRTVNFGTWNVRGLSGKEHELVEEINKYKIDILGITETKTKEQGIGMTIGNYTFIHSGVSKEERARAGVGIIIKNDILENSDHKCINERLLELNVDLKDRKLKIIVGYGPNESASKEEREEFYTQLQMVIDTTKPNQEVIILGDMNAKVGNKHEISLGAIGKEGETEESPNGELLLDFCIRNNLKIANTFFKHKNIHKWTRVVENEYRNEKSIIDYIIVNNHLFYSTNDVRVRRGAEIFSDHFLVLGTFNLTLKSKPQEKKEPIRRTIKIEDLKNINTKLDYQTRIDRMLRETQITNIEQAWSLYKGVLTESAREVCGSKTIGGRAKRTAWWNDNVKQKVKEKKEAWKKYLRSKSIEDMEKYRTKRKEACEEVKKSKQQQWEKFGEKLEENFRENQKLFWGAIKRSRRGNQCPVKHIKNEDGDVIKAEKDILDRWREYFEKLHNPNTNTEMNLRSTNANNMATADSENNTNEDDITMGELLKAKKRIKPGKAPGGDGIYPEMIVNQSKEADKLLLNICQTAYKTKTIPADWNISTIIPIHKSGSTMLCENYRGISLLSVPGKVYARIIETRLRDRVEGKISECQSGFRPGRSVHDHIYTLRQLNENTYRYNREYHACFVDLQKAFDSVNREELWKALKEHGVDLELIEAIKSFYINPESVVRIAGQTTNKFKIEKGVRQGCILSPLLFIVMMNSVSTKLKGMKPLKVGMWKLRPVQLKMLSFADDLVIFAETEKDLQKNVNMLNRELKKKGLKINDKKTKTMVVSREPTKHEIKLDGEILEQVDSYKYLGVMISSNCSLKDEINQRIGKATKVYGQLGQAFIGKKELTTKTKKSIFNAIYCPILIYGSESWTLDTRDKSRLQATEMKFLRRAIGKTKRDKIRNTRIREEINTESLESKMEKNKLRWFGHINRMEESRIPKQILECKQQGKQHRGRPKKTWLDSITETVEKRGLRMVDAKRKSLIREQWRGIVNDT